MKGERCRRVEMLPHLKAPFFIPQLKLITTVDRASFVKILTKIISHLTYCLFCSFIRGILSDFQIFLQNKIFQGCVFSYIRPPLFYRIICLVENLIILQDVGNVKH